MFRRIGMIPGSLVVAALGGASLPATVSRATEPIALGSRLEPFVDDLLIDRMAGTELRLHAPVPREVVTTFDQPWEGNIGGYYTVFDDGGKFKMYYRGEHYDVKMYPEHDAHYGGPGSSPSVTWRRPGGAPISDVSRFAGKPIRLRFLLNDADVYSMRFTQKAASRGERG